MNVQTSCWFKKDKKKNVKWGQLFYRNEAIINWVDFSFTWYFEVHIIWKLENQINFVKVEHKIRCSPAKHALSWSMFISINHNLLYFERKNWRKKIFGNSNDEYQNLATLTHKKTRSMCEFIIIMKRRKIKQIHMATRKLFIRKYSFNKMKTKTNSTFKKN